MKDNHGAKDGRCAFQVDRRPPLRVIRSALTAWAACCPGRHGTAAPRSRNELLSIRGVPLDHGYPRFIHSRHFFSGWPDWNPFPDRTDTIFRPLRTGWAFCRTLKFLLNSAAGDPRFFWQTAVLQWAPISGDRKRSHPRAGSYPDVHAPPRPASVGSFHCRRTRGSQGDHPYEIEPDKGGYRPGYAFVAACSRPAAKREYLDQGLQNARVLAANQTSRRRTRVRPWALFGPTIAAVKAGGRCREI